jgi:Zn-dependent protease
MITFNVVLIIETFAAFLIAVTIHECAHAGMAQVLGDSTPSSEGRLSLSPARHVAPIGTLVAVVLSFSYAGIGWGRPVRIDSLRMRVGPNAGIILVALAGPFANMLVGLGLAIGVTFIPGYTDLARYMDASTGACPVATGSIVGKHLESCLSVVQGAYMLRIEQFIIALAVTNVLIALINIIPLYPLDMYKVVFALLPNDQAVAWRRWEPYMEAIVLGVFFVVPVLFGFVRISVDPASIFLSFASRIVAGIVHSPGLIALYL